MTDQEQTKSFPEYCTILKQVPNTKLKEKKTLGLISDFVLFILKILFLFYF